MRILSAAAAAAGSTVGEWNAKSFVPRCAVWVAAVFLPCYCVCGAAAVCHYSMSQDAFSDSVPWRRAPVMLWGIYMALLSVVKMYMNLFLPGAPVAVRQALADVGATGIGLPLSWVAVLVAFFGGSWMPVALVCVFLALIAALLALWTWLARTYKYN